MTADQLIAELKKHPGHWTVRVYGEDVDEIKNDMEEKPWDEFDVKSTFVYDEGEIGLKFRSRWNVKG